MQGEGANEKKAYISDDVPCVDGLIRNDHGVEQNEEHDLRKCNVSEMSSGRTEVRLEGAWVAEAVL